ncbi:MULTISPECIES: hypothetical protein [unclassified Microbacterium]|uniref:hypothetical protein n=1 Tax=unclassified Microbacterium TaxID=2609290 RepID=UPI001E58EF6C|nr:MULTISPECIES: hypothetical protein [unclassified Microbacterium]
MMVAGATSDQTPGDERKPDTGSTPPLADLTSRPVPVPGPLTKPSPVVRPPRRRARWLVPAIVVAVLAAVAVGIVLWQAAQPGLA